jgi:hypothetical protein
MIVSASFAISSVAWGWTLAQTARIFQVSPLVRLLEQPFVSYLDLVQTGSQRPTEGESF